MLHLLAPIESCFAETTVAKEAHAAPNLSLDTRASAIRCHMERVRLNESFSKYTALSYVWGDPDNKAPVTVNEKTVFVTRNLEGALAQLQSELKPHEERVLWIDALCINQTDNVEKTSQVTRMGTIYAYAKDVLIWLGPEDNSSSFAIDAIEAMVVKYSNWPEETNKSFGDRQMSNINELLDDGDFRSSVPPIIQLTSRPWWNRAWVVQEVCSAKTASVQCGARTTSWLNMTRCFLLLQCVYQQDPFHPIIKPFGYVDDGVIKLVQMWQSDFYHRMWPPQPMLIELLEYMATVTDLQASDPRDKIFALTNLAADSDEDDLDISPDYSKPCSEVYTQWAQAFLKEYGPDILSDSSPRSEERPRRQDLPSWVPDWSQGIKFPLRGFMRERLGYRAGGRRSPIEQAPEFPSSDVVVLQGMLFDKISFTRNVLPEHGLNVSAEIISEWVADFVYHESFKRNRPWSRLPESYTQEAFWRTPVADRIRDRYQDGVARRAQADDFEAFITLVQDAHNHPTLPNKLLQNYLYSVWFHARGRRMFITSRGYIGLGDGRSQAGDIVIIMLGADVPYILREGAIDQYKLIGEAYVHGIMDGQGLDMNLEVRKIEIC